MKHLIIAFLVTILAFCELYAQSRSIELMISGGVAMPLGDFGDEIGDLAHLTRRSGFYFGEKTGMADMGFGFGADLITPLKLKGFDWLLSSRALFNSQSDKAAEPLFEGLLSDSVNIIFELGTNINVPILTGFRYSLSLSPNYAFYALAQAGINFSKPGSRQASAKGVIAEKTSYNWRRDFGVEVGLGVDLFRKFNLGIRYLNLNTPRYEGKRVLSEQFFPQIVWRQNPIYGEERSISMYTISLGYYLF